MNAKKKTADVKNYVLIRTVHSTVDAGEIKKDSYVNKKLK